MLAREVVLRSAAGLVGPDDLVEEVAFAKHLVHQKAQMGVHPRIDVQEDGALFLEQAAGNHQRLTHHGQVFLAAFPSVVVGRKGHGRRTGLIPLLAHAHLHIKLLAGVERRIKVHHLHLTAKARQQRLTILGQTSLNQRTGVKITGMALRTAADILSRHSISSVLTVK